MTASKRRPPPRIVIVHDGDDPQSTVHFLTDAGLTVATVSDGQDVFEGIVSADPDLIVLDFGCNGDVMQRFKNDHRTAHLPVIPLVDLIVTNNKH
jgi:DNA-binding response OmpR family regulator